jgi:hypothetical protein
MFYDLEKKKISIKEEVLVDLICLVSIMEA